MGSYATALRLADAIGAQGVEVTCDPRAATPPCVLVFVESVSYDVGLGATGAFQIFALSSSVANADAWATLDELEPAVRKALPVEGYRTVRYPLDGAGTPVLAYLFELTESVDLT
jgi:hypothetical protein